MKILDDKSWSSQFECNYCGSTLEVKSQDVSFSIPDYFIDCAACGNRIHFTENQLPKYVMRSAVQRAKYII